MKTRILFATLCFTAFVMCIAFAIYKNIAYDKNPMSNMIRQNIEALTGEETEHTYTCETKIKTTSDFNSVFFCGSCSWIDHAKPTTWSVTSKCSK